MKKLRELADELASGMPNEQEFTRQLDDFILKATQVSAQVEIKREDIKTGHDRADIVLNISMDFEASCILLLFPRNVRRLCMPPHSCAHH